MSTLYQNFDFNPVNTVAGTTALYTVPSGRYALLTISYDFSFALSRVDVDVSGNATTDQSGSQSDSLTIWLTAGNTIQLSAASSSASVTRAAGTSPAPVSITAIAGFTCSINGVFWRNFQARSSQLGYITSPSFSSNSITITPTANFGWVAQEFNFYIRN
jgi:hypothetical protein